MTTGEDLVARAAALGPRLFERRQQAMRDRRLPAETITDMIDAGLLRACQPKRFKGFELPFGTHTDIAIELARHCGSTGWVAGIIGSHSWWLAKCSPEVQEEIWGDNPDNLVGGAFNATHAKAEAKDGGYVISGAWVFASGSDHCPWAAVMVMVPNAEGLPTPRMFIMPRKDYRIDDVWRAPGLRGTGSNTIVADNVFVPEHRTISFLDLAKRVSPGQAINPGWTYRLCMPGVVHYSVSGPVIGMARAALEGFIDHMKGRSSIVDKRKLENLVNIQLRVSESAADIFAAQAVYDTDMAMMRDAAQKDRDLSREEMARIRRNGGYIGLLCKRSSQRLAEALGGNGLVDDHRVHLANDDVLAASAHMAVSWDPCGIPHGRMLLGLDPHAPVS